MEPHKKSTTEDLRTCSKPEQNYSQLEKELFAIVYGCCHYHHYLYGRKVQVITDHRPLESILIKTPPYSTTKDSMPDDVHTAV